MNAPGKRFCFACGAAIWPDRPLLSNGVPQASAERREISVMFCDAVGSTALSSRIDPEELSDIMGLYHNRISAAITRFGGFVARFMGDGVLAYFGWPRADESDTERAIQAGLATIDAAGSVLVNGEPLQVRVAICTGLVVVGGSTGSGSAHEYSVVGETPNLAARLQTMAEPRTLVISDTTHERVANLFDFRFLGSFSVRGLDRSVAVWQVLREKPVQGRLKVLHTSALTPLIGREEELEVLLRHSRQLGQGDGQVILLSGEPGIGKSRLIAELGHCLPLANHTRLEFFCSSHHQNSALHPVISYLEQRAGFEQSDSSDDKMRKLADALAPLCPSQDDLTILFELVAVSVADELPTDFPNPRGNKEQVFTALRRWFDRLAAEMPTLIVFEDIHWADPTSCELLERLVEWSRSRAVLLILTFRQEFNVPWAGQPGVISITLNRLNPRDAAAIVTGVSGGGLGLPNELLDRIVTRSDGVPLFIEELTKSVVESRLHASEGDPTPGVPSSLRGSLIARLDRLPGARQIAQIGAVIGREFSYELVAAVAQLPEPDLLDGLNRLVGSGLLFDQGQPPAAFYRFKHALVQDAAYESLLRSRRASVHARIVQAIRQCTPDVEMMRPEVLGYHCSQAGLTEEAADYYRRAGEQSISRSAVVEARVHLQRGLALVQSLDKTRASCALEARLLLALSSVLIITGGYGGPDLAATLSNAVALARNAEHRQLLIRALFGEWAFLVHIGKLSTALGVAEEMAALAASEDDAIVRIVANTSLGINYAYAGRFTEARNLFEGCLAEPGIGGAISLGSPHPQDHEVLARTYLSRTLACLGLSRRAAEEAERSIERARSLRHHPSLAMALTMGCRQAWLMRDEQLVLSRANELIQLAEQQGFPYWLARGRCYAGWVDIVQGRIETGLAQIKAALSHLQSTDVSMGNIAALVGDAYARIGDPQAALSYVDAAFRVSSQTGETWMDAELHRLKAGILSTGPSPDTNLAEEQLLRAMAIARSQGAMLWEFRASEDLARLWARQGRGIEALQLLLSARRRFAGSEATADLTAIDALIEELVQVTGADV